MAHQESECVQDLPANAKGASECLLTVGKSVKKLFKMQIRLKFSEKIGVYSGNIKTVRSPYFQNDWTPWIKKCNPNSNLQLFCSKGRGKEDIFLALTQENIVFITLICRTRNRSRAKTLEKTRKLRKTLASIAIKVEQIKYKVFKHVP